MVPTFLSIDVDYWNGLTPERLERDLSRIVSRAIHNGIQINAVMNHQQILPFVDASGALRLKNVDMHSDLVQSDVEDFECGSWVAYVKWRKQGKYIWYHRHPLSSGECNGWSPIFRSGSIRKELTDWDKLSRRSVKRLPSLGSLFKDSVGMAICLSPAYSDYDFKPIFMKIVKRFEIPYRRGRLDEPNYYVKRKPPVA